MIRVICKKCGGEWVEDGGILYGPQLPIAGPSYPIAITRKTYLCTDCYYDVMVYIEDGKKAEEKEKKINNTSSDKK